MEYTDFAFNHYFDDKTKKEPDTDTFFQRHKTEIYAGIVVLVLSLVIIISVYKYSQAPPVEPVLKSNTE